MRFSLGEIDVADKVGIVFCLFVGVVCLDTKKMALVPLMPLYGRRDLPPPCAKRENSFAVKISQVALSGPDRRVWREDLAPVDVLITEAAVTMAGRG